MLEFTATLNLMYLTSINFHQRDLFYSPVDGVVFTLTFRKDEVFFFGCVKLALYYDIIVLNHSEQKEEFLIIFKNSLIPIKTLKIDFEKWVTNFTIFDTLR